MYKQIQVLRWVASAAFALSFGTANAGPLPTGWTFTGNAGTNTATDGNVTLEPSFKSYQWLSTNGGVTGGGKLPTTATGQERDGTTVRTSTFTVAAGDKLNFFFNYITSDGEEFTEYAWAGLFNDSASFDSYLFTARTTTSGNTVPGFGLPGLGTGVTLLPAATAIIAGGPDFSPLGDDSGKCYATGCGYTGWIEMEYTFTNAGHYSLGFGVTNAIDEAYDSALAIAGVTINNISIDDNDVPEPATLALVGLSLAGLGVMRRRRQA